MQVRKNNLAINEFVLQLLCLIIRFLQDWLEKLSIREIFHTTTQKILSENFRIFVCGDKLGPATVNSLTSLADEYGR